MPDTEFAVADVPIGDLFSLKTGFDIARYQRHYEWTIEEMDQLLSDLFDAFHRACHGPVTYFLGTIVLNAVGGKLRLVDGQQRLTSLSIIFAAARDLIADPAIKQRLQTFLILPGDPLTGRAERQRLVLRRGDDAYFAAFIVAPGATSPQAEEQESAKSEEAQPAAADQQDAANPPGHAAMAENLARTREWLAGLDQHRLLDFVRFLCESCHVVKIEVTREEDAFRIFEAINTRGRRVSETDVLRFSFVEYATSDPDEQERLLAVWDAAEKRLGAEGLIDFVSQWRARVLGGRKPTSPLHNDILSAFPAPADALRHMGKAFEADITAQERMINANVKLKPPFKTPVNRVLASLLLLDFNEWQPTARLLIERHRRNPESLLQWLKKLERLCWYFYLMTGVKGNNNDRRLRLYEVLQKLSSAPACTSKEAGMELNRTEKREMRETVMGRIKPGWIPLGSVLVRIEMALRDTNSWRNVSRKITTVEHVLPQNPEDDSWFEEFGQKRFQLLKYVEQIGNLCVVPRDINPLLRNGTYVHKQNVIKRHKIMRLYKMTADIVREPVWTRAVVERRSRFFQRKLFEELDIQDEGPVRAQPQSETASEPLAAGISSLASAAADDTGTAEPAVNPAGPPPERAEPAAPDAGPVEPPSL